MHTLKLIKNVLLYSHPKFNQICSDAIEFGFQKSFANSLNNKLLILIHYYFKFSANEMKFRVISDSKKEKK